MFPQLIEKLTRHEDLTTDEASAAMAEIMAGRAAPAHIGALLVGLAMKGERPAEIVGFARTMRIHAVPVSRQFDGVFDCCGTGGDRSATFNISSCAALVVASPALVRVACHSPRQMQLANALCRLVEIAAGDVGEKGAVSGRSSTPMEAAEPALAGVQLSWLGESS